MKRKCEIFRDTGVSKNYISIYRSIYLCIYIINKTIVKPYRDLLLNTVFHEQWQMLRIN